MSVFIRGAVLYLHGVPEKGTHMIYKVDIPSFPYRTLIETLEGSLRIPIVLGRYLKKGTLAWRTAHIFEAELRSDFHA